jgi:hypothetical protein
MPTPAGSITGIAWREPAQPAANVVVDEAKQQDSICVVLPGLFIVQAKVLTGRLTSN